MSLEEYVHKTLKLIELERTAEINETRALQESVSPKELEKRGVCLLKLSTSSQYTGLYGRTMIDFESQYTGKQLPSTSFSPGDIVSLSLSSAPFNEQIESGTVTKVTNYKVSVAFDDSASLQDIDADGLFKIVKVANDVTYRRLKNALNKLNEYRSGPAESVRSVLFYEREPGVATRQGEGVQLLDGHLDESQKEAVSFALSQPEVAIVHGPPGTGKTTTVIEIIRQAVQRGLRVLACAPSNIAVDNIVERLAPHGLRLVRLGHPARLLESIHRFSLDALLNYSDEKSLAHDVRRDMDAVLKKFKKRGESREQLRQELKELRKELRQREEKAVLEVIGRSQVVLATLTTASDEGPLRTWLQKPDTCFDLVVIDECSQALEAACWIALLKGKRCVLAGDHHQLPPTIVSPEAAKAGLEVTLMDRLVKHYGERVTRMLKIQYRMNEKIMQWSSNSFYQGQLVAHVSVATHLLRDLPGVEDNHTTSVPLVLVDTAGCDVRELETDEEQQSKGNLGEVQLVAAHLSQLHASGIAIQDIAIISPYNLQVDLLRATLLPKYSQLEIKSVDGFQGREKEAIIISLVRSNAKREIGFLADRRRINVAVTRARRHLCVICDSETVSKDDILKSLIHYLTENGEIRDIHHYPDAEIGALNLPPKEAKAKEAEPKQQQQQKKAKAKKDKFMAETSERTATTTSVQRTQPRGGRGEEDEDEETKVAEEMLRREIETFVRKEQQVVYEFPTTLTAYQRKMVHQICEELGLVHVSEGQAEDRHIVVSKTKSAVSEAAIGKQEADEEEGAAALVAEAKKPSSSTPSAEKPPREREKPKKPIVKPLAKKMEKEEDLDQLLAMVHQMDNVCNYPRCKTPITMLGQNCAFCNHRFCLRHHIAEAHGCGDKAKQAARAQALRDAERMTAAAKDHGKLKPHARAYVQRKLDEKLSKLESSRKPKKDPKDPKAS